MLKEMFGSLSVTGGPVEALLAKSSRFTEMYAAEYGFARNSSRLSRRRPRLSLFAEDYPKTSRGPAWRLFWAVSGCFVPSHLAVEPCRPLQGKVARNDLPGTRFSGDGFAHQSAASCPSKCGWYPPCPAGIVAR